MPLAHKNIFETRLCQVVQCYKRRLIILISLWYLPGCWLSISKFKFWEDFINQVIWIASDTQMGSKISDALFKGFLWRVGSQKPKCSDPPLINPFFHVWSLTGREMRVLECLFRFELRADVKDRGLLESFAFKEMESCFSFRNFSR